MHKKFLNYLRAPIVSALNEEVLLFTRRYFKWREQEEKRLWLLDWMQGRWRSFGIPKPGQAYEWHDEKMGKKKPCG